MESIMPEEIFPSSYRCDCGHESHFFEGTVREMKKMSSRKKVRLADSEPDEHVIVFYRGEISEIICPHQPRSSGSKERTAKRSASKKRHANQRISAEVKTQVEEIVERFNAIEIRDSRCRYVPRYRGRFLYLDREDYGRLHPICRLEYKGAMDDWSFAICKYSDERYDDQEWFFPGSGHVNGTIEGAMKAGLEAYLACTQVKIYNENSILCY
jgi:hypothetical protein